jgi:pyruvate formate lyase activating enzyme
MEFCNPRDLGETMAQEAAISTKPDRKGWIFDIQRFSIHDGPGIRTTIFFKGCALSCLWCANPESQSQRPRLLYFSSLCTSCGACVRACPRAAVTIENDALRHDRDKCTACGACTVVCRHEARLLSGKQLSVAELCGAASKDWRLYMQTGGGITCGGGEPLQQPGFLHSLLLELHDGLGYHTCLDTCGFAPWKVFEQMLPCLDLVLLDVKHMDNARHKRLTGVSNEPILENGRELGRRGFPVLIRVPLIPGENDEEANVRALGEFLRENGLKDVELMPYHTYGLNKYRALGRVYPLSERPSPDMDGCRAILESYGLHVEVRL